MFSRPARDPPSKDEYDSFHFSMQVNGTDVDVSKVPLDNGDLLLRAVGRRFVKLQSRSCGVTVLWDGKHSVEITADKGKYGGKLTGICGDCNDKLDDFRLANGKDVSGLPAKDKYTQIGDSYRVVDAQNPLSSYVSWDLYLKVKEK